MNRAHEVELVRSERARGWSLRVQIVVALVLVLGSGWVLIGLAVDGLVMSALPPTRALALSRLLIAYAGLSSVAMLVVCYVLLTRLIVRPLEALQDAAEALARGTEARAHPHGAREAQSLALTFNAMARELDRRRTTLEARVLELTHRTDELRATQDSLVRSEKLASVGRIAAGIAHEIGNPLSAIAGLLELVRSGELSPEQSDDFLERIQSETDRIHRILRELLDYARAGTETRRDARCVVEDAIQSAIRLLEPQKELRGIAIETSFAECLPLAAIESDALTQVTVNLLMNAADAIENADADAGSIRIEVAERNARIVVLVADDGAGISPAIQARLFEPFTTSKARGRGTGLGLAVSRALVERFGGSLELERTGPEGTCFALALETVIADTRAGE